MLWRGGCPQGAGNSTQPSAMGMHCRTHGAVDNLRPPFAIRAPRRPAFAGVGTARLRLRGPAPARLLLHAGHGCMAAPRAGRILDLSQGRVGFKSTCMPIRLQYSLLY